MKNCTKKDAPYGASYQWFGAHKKYIDKLTFFFAIHFIFIHECGLEDMIAKLPNGVDTVLNDQGEQLSGGQKQRISFAREILRDTPIYLLDEATSALDKSASVKLEKAILSKKNKTVIMVTHHLREEIKQLANKVINLNEVKE